MCIYIYVYNTFYPKPYYFVNVLNYDGVRCNGVCFGRYTFTKWFFYRHRTTNRITIRIVNEKRQLFDFISADKAYTNENELPEKGMARFQTVLLL